jgi:hypothetical protein
MKNITIETPRIPPQVWYRLRQALSALVIALVIAGLIWLISSIHMNAAAVLGCFGLLISTVMIADGFLP